jgi:hypothetical protein
MPLSGHLGAQAIKEIDNAVDGVDADFVERTSGLEACVSHAQVTIGSHLAYPIFCAANSVLLL